MVILWNMNEYECGIDRILAGCWLALEKCDTNGGYYYSEWFVGL